MYSQQKVLERLEMASRKLGWVPEYHSVEEVEKFTKLMERHQFMDGNIIRVRDNEITRQEKRYIRNEQTLCACDADYFLTRYAFVRDQKNNIIRFKWRTAQRVYFDVLADMEARDYSLEMQLLKGRQLGVSTIVELLMTHRVLTGYGVNAVAASCDQQKSETMAGMMFLCIAMTPWWLKPTEVKKREGRHLAFANNCSITIQSGNQMSGIARGSTPTVVHLSELADYPDPVELVETSLFRAVHPSPKVFLMLESTGNSNVGWWADTWRYNKKFWSEGKARLRALFLPWFMGTDLYPTDTWLHMHPIPDNWRPLEETLHHIAKCEVYVHSTDILSNHLGRDWQLPREQAWYWEVNYEEHKAKRIQKKWLQEMPADDFEALQARHESVFSTETLISVDSRRERKYEIYSITGEGIEDKHAPLDSEVSFVRPRISTAYDGRGKRYTWTLIPLDPAGRETEIYDWNGRLLVFETPREGRDYSIGIDTAGGGGLDRTVISVNRVGKGIEQDVQVAELASDAINAAESYAFVMALASWYGNASTHEPKVAFEQRQAPGDIGQLQMKQMGYTNFHRFVRYDQKRIRKAKANYMGWFTNSWSRPMMLNTFVTAVDNGWLQVNSPFLLEEMAHFEARETESGIIKMEHERSKHDDRIFATAIAYFIAHDMDTVIERSKVRYNRPIEKLPELDLSPCFVNVVPFSQFAKGYPHVRS